MHRWSTARLARMVLLGPIALTLGGCFVVSWLPGRGDTPEPVAGPAPYVDQCQSCHAAPAGYAQSLHAAKGIRCGQCHRPAGHPDYTQPVRDATCGGCHQDQYQQVLASKHFATRDLRTLDTDRAARRALRAEHFTATGARGRHFVGDAKSGELGGRLCAACHYDEHRLGLGAVRQPQFCVGCHTPPHFPVPAASTTNPCMQCHVVAGTTDSGQPVNTHLIARPGGAR